MSIVQHLSTALNGTRPRSFKKMDLRFFTKLYFADTFNGKGGVTDGWGYTIYQYGGKTAYKYGKFYDEYAGCGQQSHRGDRRFEKYYEAASLYLRILEIAQAKYFGRPVPPLFPEQDVESRDAISELNEGLRLLEEHPQYLGLVEEFGLKLEPFGDEGYQLRVTVSKSYPTKDAA